MSLALSPMAFSRRLFSSFAALLVKVMAMTCQGSAGSKAHRDTALSLSSIEGLSA